MKTIYIDSEFRCHTSNDGTMTAVETDFFDNKCDKFIEGYRVIPEERAWIREDGRVFYGPMIAPWKDIRILNAYQEQYEQMAASGVIEKAAAYDILTEGASV